MRIWAISGLLLFGACSSAGVSDGGADASPNDSGTKRDVGFPPSDAGFLPDAIEPDAGLGPDLGFVPDAGEPDLGFVPDAAEPDATEPLSLIHIF